MTASVSPRMYVVPARPRDAEAIAETIRDSFSQREINLTIFGSSLAHRWVAAHLSLPEGVAEREYTVALDGDEVIGCAEVVPRGDGLQLSYIGVREKYRGQGVGTRLLAAALRRASPVVVGVMSLDVFDTNVGAKRWYEGLGFEHEGTTLLCDASACLPPGKLLGRVLGMPTASASHEAFGFSEIDVETGNERTRVGRLGSDWWRLTAPGTGVWQAAAHHELLATLVALEPARRLLLVQAGQQAPGGAIELVRLNRLAAPIDQLLDRLP